jgi:tetratricopeptide (TPR) repeat protein
MNDASEGTDDFLVEQALERWDELRDESGPPAAQAFLEGLPEALQQLLEPSIARILAAERELCGSEQRDPVSTSTAGGRPGRYEIIALHAEGGMGSVYRARDLELGRIVAYKVMKPAYARNSEARARFLREAEATADLQHPGIVPVYGMVEDQSGLPAYAMEFVEGTTLADAIRTLHGPSQAQEPNENPPTRSVRGVCRAFLGACRVVAYAHDRGYVHGDIKPHNILIDRYGATRVVDWGVSRYVQPEGGSGEGPPPDRVSRRIRTPRFHGPSAADPGMPATFASDIWALGATLTMLLSGHPPPDDPRKTEQFLRTTPPALAAVCRKAMASAPVDRYPTASALADDVQRFLDDEPVSVHRDRLSTRLRRWAIRHPGRSVAAVLTFVFTCLAITGGTVARGAWDRAARREQERIRFAGGRGPIEVLHTFGAIEYLAKDKALAVETYDNLIVQAEKRLTSEFATAADRALLGWCYYARGVVEQPGQLPLSSGNAGQERSAIERLLTLQRTRGLLTAFMDTLNRPGAVRAESWYDKAVQAFDTASKSGPLPENDRDAHQHALLGRAFMRLQAGRCTEALMDWDRLIETTDAAKSQYYKSNRFVLRMAAEQEQADPAWSRPPKAYNAETLRQAQYIAKSEGVSDAAVYNAACVFSLGSSDASVSSAERGRRADQALEYLSGIADHGYFRGEKQKRELRTDADLDPLRSLVRFRALVSGLLPKS